MIRFSCKNGIGWDENKRHGRVTEERNVVLEMKMMMMMMMMMMILEESLKEDEYIVNYVVNPAEGRSY
jgi:hypothetical protein